MAVVQLLDEGVQPDEASIGYEIIWAIQTAKKTAVDYIWVRVRIEVIITSALLCGGHRDDKRFLTFLFYLSVKRGKPRMADTIIEREEGSVGGQGSEVSRSNSMIVTLKPLNLRY